MAAGAMAGSAVPGLGTIIGAVAGLGVGLIINNTPWGRSAKKAVSNGVKKVYDGAVKGAMKIKDGISAGISKIGSLFGG